MKIGLLALIIAGLLAGASPILLKIGLREIPPLTLTTSRFFIATLVFLPVFLRFKTTKLTMGDIKNLLFVSVFFALNVGIFSIAIQYTTAIVSQLIYTLVPVLVIVLSYFFLSEKITKNKIIGLAIALSGTAFLIYQSIIKDQFLTFGTPFGNCLTLLAAFAWSFYMIFSKKLTNKYSPATITFSSFLVATLLLIVILPIEFQIRPLIINKISIAGIGSVLALALFSSALMFFLIQVVINKTSPFVASFFQYLGPFGSVVFAIPILGEKPTPSLIIAGTLMIIGVIYATYPYRKKF